MLRTERARVTKLPKGRVGGGETVGRGGLGVVVAVGGIALFNVGMAHGRLGRLGR